MKQTNAKWEQPIHSCGSDLDVAHLEVEVVDAGAGEYLVINAHEWAVESLEEIEELAKHLKDFFKANVTN